VSVDLFHQEVSVKNKLAIFALVAVLLSSLAIGRAWATLDEAKENVAKAEKFYEANGKEKTIEELNNPKGQFSQGEAYVFAYDLTGTVIAHPVNAKLVGMNNVDVPDVDGKLWRQEVLAKVKADGIAVVDYKWKNPTTNKVEEKTSYCKKVGDIILVAGTYKAK
jgi:signal transduction histidine kinase